MSQYSHYCKCHSRKVAESITWEDLARVPVVGEEGQTGGEVGYQKIQGKLVMMSQTPIQRHQIKNSNACCNDDALANLKTIDPSEYVDSIGTEDSKKTHIQIIQDS